MSTVIVPDTSIIIDGKLTELAANGRLHGMEVIIPEVVVDELEQQANKGKEVGYAGIEEIRELHDIAEDQDFTVEYVGERATTDEIELAAEGRIDALIRDVAEDYGATLYTADYVQSRIARAKGIEVKFFEKEHDVQFKLQEYFDADDIMSVHLKQGMVPMAKRGKPGDLEYVPIGEKELSKQDLSQIMRETYEKAQSSDEGLVEMNLEGATVVQIGDLRVAMSSPPFSESREITAVRPIAKVDLDSYEMTDKLKDRLTEKAEGILIAGSPGHGKSTFAQALAEFYEDEGRVIKTMEHPRDLQVGPGITQYAKLEEEFENTGDFLLLARPDYTVYDEVRKTDDFEVFADMRLAGVGMIGVVHAAEALDAVQRMIGRVEMGVIPQVVDTVIFIRNAAIDKVYSLKLTVKVPEGMMEQDLARPVIQVEDFETGEPEYEIYTYGEETVVIPVEGAAGDKKANAMERYAAQQIEHELKQWVSDASVEMTGPNSINLYVPEGKMGQVIGSGGEQINKIEKELGLSIDVNPEPEGSGTAAGGSEEKERINYHLEDQGSSVVMLVDDKHTGKEVDVFDGNEFLFTATIGKGGKMKLSKDTDMADDLLDAHANNNLRVYI